MTGIDRHIDIDVQVLYSIVTEINMIDADVPELYARETTRIWWKPQYTLSSCPVGDYK